MAVKQRYNGGRNSPPNTRTLRQLSLIIKATLAYIQTALRKSFIINTLILRIIVDSCFSFSEIVCCRKSRVDEHVERPPLAFINMSESGPKFRLVRARF